MGEYVTLCGKVGPRDDAGEETLCRDVDTHVGHHTYLSRSAIEDARELLYERAPPEPTTMKPVPDGWPCAECGKNPKLENSAICGSCLEKIMHPPTTMKPGQRCTRTDVHTNVAAGGNGGPHEFHESLHRAWERGEFGNDRCTYIEPCQPPTLGDP